MPRPWVAARIVAPPSATVSWSTTTLGRLAPSRDQLTPLFDEAYTRVFLSTRSSPSPCLWNRDARNDLLLIVLWVRAVVVGADRRRQVDIAGEVVAEVVADERVLAAEQRTAIPPRRVQLRIPGVLADSDVVAARRQGCGIKLHAGVHAVVASAIWRQGATARIDGVEL